MRVVYLSASGHVGGAERCLLDILATVREAQPEWSLSLVAAAEGPLLTRAIACGVQSTVLPFGEALARLGDATSNDRPGAVSRGVELLAAGIAASGYLGRLKRTLRSLRPDVIHSNGLKMHLLSAHAAPPGAAVLWHLHDYIGCRMLASRLLRLSAGKCAAIIANSTSVATDARAVFGDGRRVRAVPNGIDLDTFAPDGPALDLDALSGVAPAGPGIIRVGLVATMARWKGHEVFLEALARLAPHAPVRAYVIGGPIYRTDGSQHAIADLERRAKDLGIGERVRFTGFVDEPAAAMRALDVVVHCSTQPEPFGLSVAEAMACGRAVIATAGLGAGDFVTPERDLLTVVAGDAPALAACISRLVADAKLRARLGRQARLTACKSFDRRRFANELIPVYRELAGPAR
jgi:glycosyltransferase involved in cell wall biosynthesis